MEFLQAFVDPAADRHAIQAFLHGIHSSTARQYQYIWRTFQDFTCTDDPCSLSVPLIMVYLSYLFTSLQLALDAISNYLSILRDALYFGFGFTPRCHTMDLMLWGFANEWSTPYPARPFWSLQKVLAVLQSPRYLDSFISFSDTQSQVELTPDPTFMAKNEREDHHLEPVTGPA